MIPTIITILFAHWVADFIFQSQEIAANKYNNIYVLIRHICIYTTVLFSILCISKLFGINIDSEKLMQLCALNGLLHFIVDFCTSKITHYLYSKNKIHEFFVVIGFDQLLHYSCLFMTLDYFKII